MTQAVHARDPGELKCPVNRSFGARSPVAFRSAGSGSKALGTAPRPGFQPVGVDELRVGRFPVSPAWERIVAACLPGWSYAPSHDVGASIVQGVCDSARNLWVDSIVAYVEGDEFGQAR